MDIFKRGKGGTYCLRVQIRGKRFLRSLGTSIQPAAVARARQLLVQLKAEQFGLVLPAQAKAVVKSRAVASLDEIVTQYIDNPEKGPRTKTRQANANALLNLVRRATGSKSPGSLRADVLTADLVRQFQRDYLKGRTRDAVERAAAAYSCDSTLIQARSVFAHPHLLAPLVIPDLRPFREAPPLGGLREHEVAFRPMSQIEVDALESAAAGLRLTRPGVYIAYKLMAFAGLRNEEVAALRPILWIRTNGSGPRIHVATYTDFRPKGKGSFRDVGISPELLADLGELWAGREYALPGDNPTVRQNIAYREINQFVQSVVPERHAYDLRKQAGSNVLHQTHDLFTCARWLGHASVATTQRWYVGLLDQSPVLTSLRGVA